jgi:hypothetical protein
MLKNLKAFENDSAVRLVILKVERGPRGDTVLACGYMKSKKPNLNELNSIAFGHWSGAFSIIQFNIPLISLSG